MRKFLESIEMSVYQKSKDTIAIIFEPERRLIKIIHIIRKKKLVEIFATLRGKTAWRISLKQNLLKAIDA